MIYQLYPIPLCDVNLPVYYMVKSYFYSRTLEKTADNLEEEWQRLKVNHTSFPDYLLFPSADHHQEYDADTLSREVIILKDRSKKIPREDPKPYNPDDDIGIYGIDFSQYEPENVDIEPHETHYYIDTGKLLIQSINKLLPVVQEARLGQGQWEERLKTTRSMVKARANALHILHNGGLYDIHSLEHLLSHSIISVADWRPLLDEYTKNLKILAMNEATR